MTTPGPVHLDDPAPRFTRTPHLVGLVAEVERLAAVVARAPAAERAAARDGALTDAALASLRLDGSPLEQPPELPTGIESEVVGGEGPDQAGSWFDTFQVFERDERVQALEYLGVRSALESDELAQQLTTSPLDALRALHARLTRGLVAPERVGASRTTEQAVHDASTGRVLFFTPDPARVESRLAVLEGWLIPAAAREHPLVVSGVLHLELLALHPFDAANGRLARAAARLLLRARDLDPDALPTPEVALLDDAIGYYQDVAATRRRRDATMWLERWGEAVAEGLRDAARRLDLLAPEVPERARAFVASRVSPSFTVADYRAEVGVGPEDTRADLDQLLLAGHARRVPGSRGLRFTLRSP